MVRSRNGSITAHGMEHTKKQLGDSETAYPANGEEEDTVPANGPVDENHLSHTFITIATNLLGSTIGRKTVGWNKKKDDDIQKKYIAEEDQFVGEKEPSDHREAGDKSDRLLYTDEDLLSEERDEGLKLLSEKCQLLVVDDQLSSAYCQIKQFFLYNPKAKLKSHDPQGSCLKNGSQSRVEDVPQQGRSQKKMAPAVSGYVPENVPKERLQYQGHMKNSFLLQYVQAENKMNILYPIEDIYFKERGIDIQDDDFASHDYARMKLYTGAWTDSGGGIPDSCGERHKSDLKHKEDLEKLYLKRKEDPDLEFNVDMTFPKQHNLRRKTSIDQVSGGHREHEDHGGHGFSNIQIDPMVKIGVADLRPYAESKIMDVRRDQSGAETQDIVSADSNDAVGNSGESSRPEAGILATSQSPSTDNTEEHKDLCGEESKAEDVEEGSVEGLPECAADLDAMPDEWKDNGKGSRHSASASQSASTQTDPSSSLPGREMLKGGTSTGQSVNVAISELDQNTELESATADGSAHLKEDMEEDGGGCAFPAGYSVPQTCSSPLSLSQHSLDSETPAVSFCEPVQVSSPGNSAHFISQCSGHEWSSSFALHDEDCVAACSENSITVAAQESQSDEDLGACGGQASVVTQEQACPGIVEIKVFSRTPQEQSPVQREPCLLPAQSGLSLAAQQDPPLSENRIQSGGRRCWSQPVQASQSAATQQSAMFLSHPPPVQPPDAGSSLPVQLPPVTVHAASSLPPWAARTARIDLSRATDRQFVPLRKRRGTYGGDWPDSGGIEVSSMALSGFFVIGPGRRVRCFYCGLVLDYLTSDHNVWNEHVRHSPDCRYLNAIMGSDFVQDTLRNLSEDRRQAP
ncbi:uncharacterized protein LOC143282827 [Babylonia areolata]|uniref:uncharacterized protein LOC143282827 n=1 Tax=Babylonia areolata TaxID=304850 RepID=UPI003FD238CB